MRRSLIMTALALVSLSALVSSWILRTEGSPPPTLHMTDQEATSSPVATAAETSVPTATLPGQASLRLSMPFLKLPASPTPPIVRPTVTPWPTPPVQQLTDNVTTVAAAGGFAYLGAGSTLIVVDARDPARPEVVGKTEWMWPERMEAMDMAVVGDTVFILGLNSAYRANDPTTGSWIAAVDVAIPEVPSVLDLLQLHEASFSLKAVGTSLFVAGFRPNRSCEGQDGGLIVIDAANPSSLVRRACAPVDGVSLAVSASRDRAILTYSADPGDTAHDWPSAGLMWFDISNPLQPRVTRQAMLPFFELPRLLAHARDSFLITDPGGSLVFGSVSDLDAGLRPVDGPVASPCDSSGLIATATAFILRAGRFCQHPSLLILSGEIDEPEFRGDRVQARVMGQLDLQYVPETIASYGWNSMAQADGRVFIVDPGAGGILTIVDISRPEAPRVVGRLD